MNKSKGYPWMPVLSLMILVLLLEQGVEYFLRESQHRDEQVRVVNHLSQVRAKLEGIVNSNLLALRGLTAVIAVHPDMQQAEFARIAHELVENNGALRNIAAAPDLVITMMYPLEGNEAALGLNYRTHPTQTEAALRAIESASMVLAGPLELVQGGVGVVARAPVFTDWGAGDGSRHLWGLVSSVLDFKTLLKKSGLDAPDMPVAIAIRGVDGTGQDGRVFFGDADIFNRSSVWSEVVLPVGSWQMAAIPTAGWGGSRSSLMLWMVRLVGVLFSLLAALTLHLRRRNRLVQEQAARDLSISQARLNEALRVTRVGSWELDLTSHRLYWSDEVFRIFEMEPDSSAPIYQVFLNHVHPEDRERVGLAYTGAMTNQTTYDIDHRLLLANGRIKYVSQHGKTFYDDDGSPLRSVGIIQDLTEQHSQKRELLHLHAMLTALVEGSSDAIFVKDKESRYLLGNHALSRIIGKPLDRIIGVDDFALFPESLARQFQDDDQRVMELREVKSYEEVVITPTATLPFLTIKGPLLIDGEIKGVFGIARDITPLKQAEQQIRRALAETQQREAELEAVFQALPDLFFRMAADGTILGYRARQSSDLYIPAENFLGKRMQDVLPQEVGLQFVRKMDELSTAVGIITYEYDLVMPDGKRRYEARLTRLADTDQLIAVVRDIHEQYQDRLALEWSERRFRNLYQKTPVMMHAIGLDGRLQEVSDHWLATLGYSREDVIGREVADFLAPGSGRRVKEVNLPRLIEIGYVEQAEMEFITKSGELLDIELSAIPEFNPDGSIQRGLAVLINVTERKRAERDLRESERRLATLMSNLPGMVYRCRNDKYWTMEFVSDGCKALTGYDPDSLLHNQKLAFVEMMDAEDVERILEEVQRGVDAGEPFEVVYRVRRKDGDQRWFWEKGQYVRTTPDGDIMLEGFIIDITDRKQAETALQRAHDELEQRVVERTTELREANQELEAFTYSVSHDLRAPLRAISGFSHFLWEEYGESLDPVARGYLDQVIKGGHRMKELIEGLLRLSRSTQVEMVRLELDLSRLAFEVLDELRTGEPERRVEVEIQPGLLAKGDPRLLRTVLQNLLGNAWKYTENTEHPQIRFSGEQQEGSWNYRIEDNGAGFNMDYAGKMFMPFQRLHQQNEFTGVGIGLATVQRIIQRHGGRIWARGREGEGAVFCFTLEG